MLHQSPPAWCFCCCCYCCGWCWCEATWSVPQHRLEDRTTARLRNLLHDALVGGKRRRGGYLLVGLGLAGKAGGKGPGKAGPPLAAAHSSRMPPPPHPTRPLLSSTASPTPQLTTAGPLLTFFSQSVFPSPRHRRIPSISCRQIAAKPQCDVPMLREDMPDRCLSTEASTEEFFTRLWPRPWSSNILQDRSRAGYNGSRANPNGPRPQIRSESTHLSSRQTTSGSVFRTQYRHTQHYVTAHLLHTAQ